MILRHSKTVLHSMRDTFHLTVRLLKCGLENNRCKMQMASFSTLRVTHFCFSRKNEQSYQKQTSECYTGNNVVSAVDCFMHCILSF